MSTNNINTYFYEGKMLRQRAILYLNRKLPMNEMPPFAQVMYRSVNLSHPDAENINSINEMKALKRQMNIEFVKKITKYKKIIENE